MPCRSPPSSSATPCSVPRSGAALPVHVDDADTDLADRARTVDRRLTRRPGDGRSGVRRRGDRCRDPGERLAALLAASVEAISYIAVFIAIGCLTRRTAVWSLAFVFLVERLLGAALTGIAQLSPTWESRATFVGLLDDPPERLVREGIPSGGSAIVRLLVVSAVALAVASWRMRHLRLAGAAD